MTDTILLEQAPVADVTDDPTTAKRSSGTLIAVALVFLAAVFFQVGLFGFRPAVVSGGSMEPKWHRGDVVISRSVDADSLKVGDIVTFGANGTRIVHRITAIEVVGGQRRFVTQGDDNPVADVPVPAGAIEGKVIFSVATLGRPVLIVQSWLSEVL
jgi:signal peptidase I